MKQGYIEKGSKNKLLNFIGVHWGGQALSPFCEASCTMGSHQQCGHGHEP